MKNITIQIVEDNVDFSTILGMFLNQLGYQNIVICNNYTDGWKTFKNKKPDLVILDVDFGEKKSGIDLGFDIRQANAFIPIIFITENYNDSVYEEAMTITPSAFLNKELSMLKVRQAVELALEMGHKFDTFSEHSNKHQILNQENIFVKVGTNFRRIKLKEIDYFYYKDRYINLVFQDRTFTISGTMKDLITTLPRTHFIQIHQSYIINKDSIDRISFTNDEVEVCGNTFPIGVRYKKQMKTILSLLQ